MAPSAARRKAKGSLEPVGFSPIAKKPTSVSNLSASATATLAGALDRATAGDNQQRVLLRADNTVPYGELMSLMNELRGAGYLHVALVGLEADKM